MGPFRGPRLGSDCSGVRGAEPGSASLPIATTTKDPGSDSGSDWAGGCITDPVEYTLYGEPLPWSRPRANGRRHFTPQKVLDEQARHLEAFELGKPSGWRTDGGFAVYVVAYRQTRRRVDGDNLLKLVLDALNKRAFDDDSQVDVMRVEKRVDRDDPRTEVRVFRIAETTTPTIAREVT